MIDNSKRKRNLKLDTHVEMMNPSCKRWYFMKRRMREEAMCKAMTSAVILKHSHLLLVPSLSVILNCSFCFPSCLFVCFSSNAFFPCHSGRLENKRKGSKIRNADLMKIQSMHLEIRNHNFEHKYVFLNLILF